MWSVKNTRHFYFILLKAGQSLYSVKVEVCRKQVSQQHSKLPIWLSTCCWCLPYCVRLWKDLSQEDITIGSKKICLCVTECASGLTKLIMYSEGKHTFLPSTHISLYFFSAAIIKGNYIWCLTSSLVLYETINLPL